MKVSIEKTLFSCLLLASLNIYPSIEDYFPQDLGPSSSNYGEVGLMEIPTARFMDEGSLKIGISASYPNEHTYMVATPFSWLEATYRYAELKNRLYGPYEYSGNQTDKDKGFDVRFRLLEESYLLPQIALGIKDIAGTGYFSSEYIVGSKKIQNLDFTLGVGWGLLGGSGNIGNPLSNIHESFGNIRENNAAEGGTFNFNSWFSGDRASIFGGVEYYLNKYGLVFKLEYDTTNHDQVFLGSTEPPRTRYNFGVSRPFGKWLDLGLSYERGSEFRMSFSFKGNYGTEELVPKYDPPKNVISLNQEQKKNISKDKPLFYRSLNKSLREEAIYIQGATLNEQSADVIIAQSRFRSYPRAVGRTARIVSALSPDQVEELNIVVMNGDLEVSSISMSRNEYDSTSKFKSSSAELLAKTKLRSIEEGLPTIGTTDFKPTVNFPELFWSMTPALRHQIGGPEAFYLGQLWWKINSTVKFKRGLSLHTILGLDIYNTFNDFRNSSDSTIPHVRSDIQDYLSEGKNNIARMKLDYIWSPRKDLFARLDVGYLEEMFGGIGGELYYRPFSRNFSTSITLHAVKQRAYDQKFSFRDYETVTGHLGLYYDFPQGIHGQLLLGKYLAKDKGATFDLSRRFKNGFTLGIFATKTNLSAEEFGEGSFDKGFYFAIPLDLFYSKYRTGNISFGMHPLTKDGGAILNHHNSLYSLLSDTNKDSLLRDWSDILD